MPYHAEPTARTDSDLGSFRIDSGERMSGMSP